MKAGGRRGISLTTSATVALLSAIIFKFDKAVLHVLWASRRGWQQSPAD
jgi:hypothetical protein